MTSLDSGIHLNFGPENTNTFKKMEYEYIFLISNGIQWIHLFYTIKSVKCTIVTKNTGLKLKYCRTWKFHEISRIWPIGNSHAWKFPQPSNGGFCIENYYGKETTFHADIGMLYLLGKFLTCKIFWCMEISRILQNFAKFACKHYMHTIISCSTVQQPGAMIAIRYNWLLNSKSPWNSLPKEVIFEPESGASL